MTRFRSLAAPASFGFSRPLPSTIRPAGSPKVESLRPHEQDDVTTLGEAHARILMLEDRLARSHLALVARNFTVDQLVTLVQRSRDAALDAGAWLAKHTDSTAQQSFFDTEGGQTIEWLANLRRRGCL